MDDIIPVLPTGVHPKWLGGKNRDALHRWACLLLSFCQKIWLSQVLVPFGEQVAAWNSYLSPFSSQLITGSFSHHLAPPCSHFQRAHITLSSYGII